MFITFATLQPVAQPYTVSFLDQIPAGPRPKHTPKSAIGHTDWLLLHETSKLIVTGN